MVSKLVFFLGKTLWFDYIIFTHHDYHDFRLEVPQQQVWSILIPISFPDIPEDPTSISKRRRMPNPVVASTTRREDTLGPSRPSEETELVLVEWDLLDTSIEEKRTAGEAEPKPPRRSRHEPLERHSLFYSTMDALPKIVLKLS